MKAGWQVKPLATISKLFADGDWIESKDQSADGVRLVQTGNVGEGFFKDRGEKARYISKETFVRLRCTEIFEGDCLISRLPDPVGRSCLLPDTGERMITAVDCTIVRFDSSQFLPDFFVYYTQSSDYLNNVDKETSGTTRKRISRSKLGEISIPVPPIQEQQRIVAILDQAFEGIAKARANAEQNLQNARALFESHLQSVFSVRGDLVTPPVRPELVEGWHGSTSSPRTGDDWEVRSFAEVLEIKNGKDQKPVEKAGGKYPIYGSAGNIMGWTDSYICDEQTTIIGRKGTINRPILIETKFWNVDTAFGLAAKPNLNAKFLYYFCLSYDFSLHNRGTTIPSLVKTDLLNIKISIPSLSAQELLVKKFTALHNETQRLEALYQRKIASLDELKKSLLQQAFAGEL